MRAAQIVAQELGVVEGANAAMAIFDEEFEVQEEAVVIGEEIIEGAAIGFGTILLAAFVVIGLAYIIYELLEVDYTSNILVVNLSKTYSFKFTQGYFDNVDNVPENLKSDVSDGSNILPSKTEVGCFGNDFHPDESKVSMAFIQIENRWKQEGLVTLIVFENLNKTGKLNNFLHLYEIHRLEKNQQNVKINYVGNDYQRYYEDSSHKVKEERIEKEFVGGKIISQTNKLSGAEHGTYNTVVIIMDK